MRILNLLTAAFLPTALLAIDVTVVNYCPFSVFLLSVISGGQPIAGPLEIPGDNPFDNIPPSTYKENSSDQGRAIKIVSSRDGWWTGAPQLIWGYSSDPAGTYTSISTVPRDRSPLEGRRVSLQGKGFDCPTITWENGKDPMKDKIINCR
jgi:hypothetical protein